ncbi:MAG: hypothetical protein H6687_00785 [Bacillales bacterium]|nr:hypothetical protein [Bacillales bacterium]
MDWDSIITTSIIMGELNIFAGLASSMAGISGAAGKSIASSTASEVDSIVALRIVAGFIAGASEALYDAACYLINKMLSLF